jgi:hypothetical protein
MPLSPVGCVTDSHRKKLPNTVLRVLRAQFKGHQPSVLPPPSKITSAVLTLWSVGTFLWQKGQPGTCFGFSSFLGARFVGAPKMVILGFQVFQRQEGGGWG